MKKLILLLLMAGSAFGATTFTEFYVQTTGNNLNAGSTTDDTAPFAYTGTWVAGTGTFTVGSGNPSADGVTAGMWASFYTTSGATNADYVALVTNVTTSTIVVSLAAAGGTIANVDTGAGNASCKVGGAWKGPNTNAVKSAAMFPFYLVAATMTNNPQVFPRINFKAGRYDTTNIITIATVGPVRIQGYSSSPGDGGRAQISAAWTGAIGTLFTLSGQNWDFQDMIFSGHGSGSGGFCMNISGSRYTFKNCTWHDFNEAATQGIVSAVFLGCEAYRCNLGNNANEAAFYYGGQYVNCLAYSNSPSQSASAGFGGPSASMCVNCVAYGNGGAGFKASGANSSLYTFNCDAYQNASDGFDFGENFGTATAVNCNSIANGGWGFNNSAGTAQPKTGFLINCGVGSGAAANSSGTVNTANLGAVNVVNLTTYGSGVTPWLDPANRNFAIVAGSAGANQGFGVWTNTQLPTNWTSYPSIGASYPTNSGGSPGGTVGYGFAQ